MDKLLQKSKDIDLVNSKSASVLLIIYSKERRMAWNAKGEEILAENAALRSDDSSSYNRKDYFQKRLDR